MVVLSAVWGPRQIRRGGPTCDSESGLGRVLPRPYPGASLNDALRRKARPLHALSRRFRPPCPPSKMAEEQESALQLPPSTAPEAEGPTEVSPETATPEPPSSAAVSPGTEEPVGDTKKKSNFQSAVSGQRREVEVVFEKGWRLISKI